MTFFFTTFIDERARGIRAGAEGDHIFFFLSIGYDAVFDGLSESEIKNSADVT